jgi:hypothetical protein
VVVEIDGNGEFGLDIEPAFLDRAEALKWPHFGQTYSVVKNELCGYRGNQTNGIRKRYEGETSSVEIRTGTFPDTFLYKSIMIETLLTNQRIPGGSNRVVAKESVSKLVIPLFTQRLNRLRRSCDNELNR